MSDLQRPETVTRPAASRGVLGRLLRGEFGFARTLLWFLLGGNVVLELISRLVPDLVGKGWLLIVSSPWQALVLVGLWRSSGALMPGLRRRLAQGFVVVGWIVLALMTVGGLTIVSGQ